MRKFALLASSAGALFSILVAPNQVDAMSFSNLAGALNVLATRDDATKPEPVRWCRARYCRGRYNEPPTPYYWGWGWYRPWPYYPYYNFGTGQSSFGFAH